jgi:hypothetical protein
VFEKREREREREREIPCAMQREGTWYSVLAKRTPKLHGHSGPDQNQSGLAIRLLVNTLSVPTDPPVADDRALIVPLSLRLWSALRLCSWLLSRLRLGSHRGRRGLAAHRGCQLVHALLRLGLREPRRQMLRAMRSASCCWKFDGRCDTPMPVGRCICSMRIYH